MAILAKNLSGHNLREDHWIVPNVGLRKFSMFVPNLMKIERGQDFYFFIDLEWNDPYKKQPWGISTLLQSECYFSYYF